MDGCFHQPPYCIDCLCQIKKLLKHYYALRRNRVHGTHTTSSCVYVELRRDLLKPVIEHETRVE